MAQIDFHHALNINTDKCIGCTHCMKVCPTQAIRVREGKAMLLNNRCIDCGECYRVCPVSAIFVEQDDFSKIFEYKFRVALVPSIFIGQFPRHHVTRKIYSCLAELGFTHVYEAEHATDLLSEVINNYIDHPSIPKPVISTYCPAVVRLIQVKFPGLVDHIMNLKPPAEIAALSFKKHLIESEGADPQEIGMFYVSPCAAKIASVKSPVGEHVVFQGVINMDFLFDRVYTEMKKSDKLVSPFVRKEQLTDREMLWSLSHGESRHIKGRTLAVDGINNVIRFLQRLENEDVGHFDFLELRACDQSCAGGILSSNNRFLAVERMENRAKRFLNDEKIGKTLISKSLPKYKNFLIENITVGELSPRSIDSLDDDRVEAFKKLERVRNMMCYLPGIDCAVCGAPSCQSLAEDIVQHRGKISDCIFVSEQMQAKNIMPINRGVKIIEKIWGSGRFEKDCTKKGAKNESIGGHSAIES